MFVSYDLVWYNKLLKMDIFSGNISIAHKGRKFKKYIPKERYTMSEENMWDKNKEKEMSCNCTSKFQEVVIGGLETLFYKYGQFVAR